MDLRPVVVEHYGQFWKFKRNDFLNMISALSQGNAVAYLQYGGKPLKHKPSCIHRNSDKTDYWSDGRCRFYQLYQGTPEHFRVLFEKYEEIEGFN